MNLKSHGYGSQSFIANQNVHRAILKIGKSFIKTRDVVVALDIMCPTPRPIGQKFNPWTYNRFSLIYITEQIHHLTINDKMTKHN